MHLPECTLIRGGFGGFGRQLRMGVDVRQRQVTPDVAHVGEVAEKLANDGLGLPAVGAGVPTRTRSRPAPGLPRLEAADLVALDDEPPGGAHRAPGGVRVGGD